jgi:hypothetical protein
MIWQISQIGRENRLRREEKSERKPSGCPFTFNNPPQREIAKLVNSQINNFAILQTAWRKARQGFLTSCYMYHLPWVISRRGYTFLPPFRTRGMTGNRL